MKLLKKITMILLKEYVNRFLIVFVLVSQIEDIVDNECHCCLSGIYWFVSEFTSPNDINDKQFANLFLRSF